MIVFKINEYFHRPSPGTNEHPIAWKLMILRQIRTGSHFLQVYVVPSKILAIQDRFISKILMIRIPNSKIEFSRIWTCQYTRNFTLSSNPATVYSYLQYKYRLYRKYFIQKIDFDFFEIYDFFYTPHHGPHIVYYANCVFHR